MRANIAVAGVAIVLVVGCASSSVDVLSDADAGAEHSKDAVRKTAVTASADRLFGAYRFSDGFWSWEIHLMPGANYEVFSISDILEEDAHGKLRRGVSRVAKGGWAVEGGSVILRNGDAAAQVWTIVDVAGVTALMEPSGARRARRVYTHTEHPITQPKEPNQSPEPTPAVGTSAAEQPLVPAAGVAHL